MYSPQFTSENNGKIYRYVEENMMLEKRWKPQENALWRTSLSYIAYGEEILKKGIMSCYRQTSDEKGLYVQGMRYPGRYGEDDFSRDQLTSSLAALKIRNNIEELKYIKDNIRRKISKKFKITIDMLFWMKSLEGNKWYGFLFHLMSIFIVLTGLITNRIAKKWTYPKYAYHLFALQFYTSSKSFLKGLLKRIGWLGLEEDNYFCKTLLGKKITLFEMEDYEPRIGWKWQDDTDNRILTKQEAEYNATDKDILYYMRGIV